MVASHTSLFYFLSLITSSCEKQLPVYLNADASDFLSELSEGNNELNKKTEVFFSSSSDFMKHSNTHSKILNKMESTSVSFLFGFI